MPFVLDLDQGSNRPRKRRRMTRNPDMAHRWWQDAELSTEEEVDNKDAEVQASEMRHSDSEPVAPSIVETSDREELMQCIKRGQRAEWKPKSGLKALHEEDAAYQAALEARKDDLIPTLEMERPASATHVSEPTFQSSSLPDHNSRGSIECPPSALHAGDFRSDSPHAHIGMAISADIKLSNSTSRSPSNVSPSSWVSSSHLLTSSRISTDSRALDLGPAGPVMRYRAPSLGSSLSSSFVMRVPTSPLVQATSNPSLSASPPRDPPHHQRNPSTTFRRSTMPSIAFQTLGLSSLELTPPNFSRPLHHPVVRREESSPQQGHRPRRSLTSFTYQNVAKSPSSGSPRVRRLSLSSEISRSSMVGSFEESILRGRMSTPPSKPLEFLAQIGVLGKGDCPANLKCPAHVTVPFSAVFYSYPSTTSSRTISDDTPSPYVGTIDLEHNLKSPLSSAKRKRESHVPSEGQSLVLDEGTFERAPKHVMHSKGGRSHKSTTTSAKVPPGGSYRVAQQGQLQIIIKNANKTAVKLFLVPYDLGDMKPGTKTFVRQRSFSSGPILEKALTDKPEGSKVKDPLQDKHILRYLIHLKFCCTVKDRFYLHDKVRVVFANRVPDGKEKLRNEVQLPEPRFSSYRPAPQTNHSKSKEGSFDSPLDRHETVVHMSQHYDTIDGIGRRSSHDRAENRPPPSSLPIPFHLAQKPAFAHYQQEKHDNAHLPDLASMPFQWAGPPSRGMTTTAVPERTLSPVPGFLPSTSTRASPVPWTNGSGSSSRSFSPAPPEAGDGLLSRQLRKWNNMKVNGTCSEGEEVNEADR